MPWVIGFIAAWILFILVADRKNLKIFIWGGVVSLVLSTIVDWRSQKLQLYEFTNLIIPWFDYSAFYKFGPSFTLGVQFVQSIPEKRHMQVLNILVFIAAFSSYEYITVHTYAARYIHWSIFASIILDFFIFSSMTWLSQTFLKPKAQT